MHDTVVSARSAVEIARSIRKKEVSPIEVVRDALERIHRYDPKLNAFMRVCGDDALVAAKKAEQQAIRGQWRGPLHGVPFAVKDLIDTTGVENTAGSIIWRNFVPLQDAPMIQRLREAGAIILGKLSMHEFAFGITSRNPHYGPTFNPWDRSRMCGGSSSGSAAAIAAGFVPFTLGSDTGGSIRIPAALCGVLGLKPTYGRVTRRGSFPLSWSLDHIGPMARYVQDLALVLGIIAGSDPKDPTTAGGPVPDYLAAIEADPKGIRIGLPTEYFFEDLRDDVKSAVLQAAADLETLGARVENVLIPGIRAADRAAHTVLFAEAAACLESHVRERSEDIGEEVMANLRLGMTIPATRYIQAMRVRTLFQKELSAVFGKVDALLVPTCAVDAPRIGDTAVHIDPERSVDVRTALTRFTRCFNLAGNPALSMFCGRSADGLPVGCQLVGAPFGEATILAIAQAYQGFFHPIQAIPELEP